MIKEKAQEIIPRLANKAFADKVTVRSLVDTEYKGVLSDDSCEILYQNVLSYYLQSLIELVHDYKLIGARQRDELKAHLEMILDMWLEKCSEPPPSLKPVVYSGFVRSFELFQKLTKCDPGITSKELARLCGVHVNTVNAWRKKQEVKK